jgi:hypothetical protein
MSLPASSRPPGPTAMISPCEGFSRAVSGITMPPADFLRDQYARQQHDRVMGGQVVDWTTTEFHCCSPAVSSKSVADWTADRYFESCSLWVRY